MTPFFIKFLPICFVVCFAVAFLVIKLVRCSKEFPMTVMAFVSFVITILNFNPFFEDQIEGWIRVVWLTDYSFGIINRGFCGEILSLINKFFFHSDKITDEKLHIVFNCLLVTAMVVSLIWIHYVEKRDDSNEGIRALLILWIISPFFTTFFYTGPNLIGRLDIVLLILFFISLLLICSNRCLWLLVPISICSVLVYHEFTILLFPFVFILILKKFIESRERKVLLVTICTTVGTLITTVYIYFFGRLKEDAISRPNFFDWMQAKTDIELDFGMALTYSFGGTGIGYSDISVNHLYFRFILLILACVPIVLFVSMIFFKLLQNRSEGKRRIVYILMLISPCVIFFTLISDLLRYWACFCTGYINAAVSMGIINKSGVYIETEHVDKIFSQKFGKHYLTYFCAILLLVDVTVNSSWPFMRASSTIVAAVDDAVYSIKTNELPLITYDITDIRADGVTSPDMVNGTTIIEEYILFERNARNICINIQPVTWGKKYSDDMTLHVELENIETGKIKGYVEIPANQLPNNREYSILFNGSEVVAGTWYRFRFYMTGTANEHAFCLMYSDEGTAEPSRHYVKVSENNDSLITKERVSYDVISKIVGASKSG